MQLETILTILQTNQDDLSRRGVLSLVLIGPHAALGAGQALHFLIDLDPPHTYERLRELTLGMTSLLGYPAELVLVSPTHSAVQPYLDPDAIVII